MNAKPESPEGFPQTRSSGSARVGIGWQPNPKQRLDKESGQLLVKPGKFSDLYPLASYEPAQVPDPITGEMRAVQQRVRQKSAGLSKAGREARRILNRLAHLDGGALSHE